MVYSAAALAIAKRKGSGKLRHINEALLWLQEKEDREELTFHKVKGMANPADLMAKHVFAEVMEKHASKVGLIQREGRASESLKVQGRRSEDQSEAQVA